MNTLKPTKLKSNKSYRIVLLSMFFCLGLVLFHQPMLKEAGRFLAPNGTGVAEVLIVEGTQAVKVDAINAGIRLLADEKAKRMVVVLHQFVKRGQTVALQEEYGHLLMGESGRFGIEKGRFQVVLAPIDGHPITLKEAKFVVEKMSGEGVKSAILLSEGFHTRRSFGVYSQEGTRVSLRIIPSPYFSEYTRDDWWQHTEGVRDFVNELFKLAYYLFRGFISVESLSVTG